MRTKEQQRAYYLANRDKILADAKRRYAEDEAFRVRRKRGSAEWQEKNKAACKAKRDAKKDVLNARRKAHYEANRERELARKKEYQAANLEKRRLARRAWAAARGTNRSLPELEEQAARSARGAFLRDWRSMARRAAMQLKAEARAEWAARAPEREREYNLRYAQEYMPRYRATESGRRAITNGAQRRRARKKQLVSTLTTQEWRAIIIDWGMRCAYCHRDLGGTVITMDHVIPISKGGQHTKDNVVPACRHCNSRKHTRLITPSKIQPVIEAR